MKKYLALLSALLVAAACKETAQTYDWQPAGDHILTEWGENLDPGNVLPEYPRPQMVRAKWINLNGFWDYKTRLSSGKILVPFPVESALSGVGERLGADSVIVYKTTVDLPSGYLKQHVLLNCGGIDCISEIEVNGEYVRKHKGGFTAISEDITEYLKKGENEIKITVTDRTDGDYNAIGKQRVDNGGIFYSPVSGIWQTIWLEPVSETHIENLKITPYLDLNTFTVNAATSTGRGEVEVKIYDGKSQVASGKGAAGSNINIKLKAPKLWSPDDPFLYDFKIVVRDGSKKVDEVTSYAAMRKVSANYDSFGKLRIALNNKPIFSNGLLDQGWWPDGLYTAPSDEALEFDIRRTKELGYNTIRKHMKVEPDRWYYHCDRLGVMVWQDMPSGDYGASPKWVTPYDEPLPLPGSDTLRCAESIKQYQKDWDGIMSQLHNHPCIIMWVPFNEAWGQFNTVEVATATKLKDPTRLVNAASGGNFYPGGDVIDFHNYSETPLPGQTPRKDFIVVMGEYGGLGLSVPEHTWCEDGWGYRKIGDSKTLTDKYIALVRQILKSVDDKDIAGAIYTQTTDCESEINGIYTYDRKVLKFDEERFVEANRRLSHIFD